MRQPTIATRRHAALCTVLMGCSIGGDPVDANRNPICAEHGAGGKDAGPPPPSDDGAPVPTAPRPAGLVFFDDFEYNVGRSDPNAVALFQAAGWTGAKTEQANRPGANGWLYTANAIGGFAGTFPGRSSSRVLVIEARPESEGGQTDFYLQLGNASSTEFDDYIPGDVWFQFWMYPQDSGAQQSTYYNRNKFFYVCNDAYPCHSHLWMFNQTSATADLTTPAGYPADGQFFWSVAAADGVSMIDNSLGDPYTRGRIGQTDVEWMRPNRWTLVKMHFNTTRTTGNSWEMWLRPQGGTWIKSAEWIGGVTPGFTWNIPAASVGGHRELRMPTTIGYEPGGGWRGDAWMYMDDFAMATSEAALPTYSN